MKTIRITRTSISRSAALLSTAVLAAFLAIPAVAQPGGPGGPGFRGGPPEDGQEHERRHERLVEILGLDEQQAAAWEAAHEAQRERLQPIFEQIRANREATEEAFEVEDATLIGTLMLESRALHEQVKAEHGALQAELESLLTEEQRIRWETLREAHGDRGRRPGRRGPRGPRGPGGPGSGS